MRFAGENLNVDMLSPLMGLPLMGDIASARNLREPFPMRQDIIRPLNTIPTHPIMGPDGRDKFPGFEIRSVMPKV